LRSTAGEVLQIPSLLFFLFAYWLYIEGVNTVYMMATDYGLSIGLPLSTLMIALLIVQFVAFPSSIAFSFLAERIGARRTILVAIGVYIAITGAGGWLITTGRDFILFAAMTGAVQGTIQALSRSLFSRMVPQEKAADFFGIYNMIGRFAVILGPGLVGGINWICYKYGVSSITSARLGVSSIALLFVAGGLLLLQVKDMERR
jgi:UMF1 family MFS transporter